MPTGYTAGIEKGISFNKFVTGCARAFGACITMRDDSSNTKIPESFKPSDYHVKALKKASADLKLLQSMTTAATEKEAEKDFKIEVKERQKSIEKNNKLLSKYQDMLQKVNRWQPPTPKHVGLKDFMAKQISESIDWDCDNGYYADNPSKRLSGHEWLSKEVSKALRDISYHETENQKEIERSNGRTDWVQQLRESL